MNGHTHHEPASPRELFPGVFYINLEFRGDRRAEVESELARVGLGATRYPAVWLGQDERIELRQLGCKLSHLGVLAEAKRRSLEHVLILEDDVQFVPQFNDLVAEVMTDVASEAWDLLYLGYEGFNYDHARLLRVTARIARVRSVYLTHCYLVHSRAFERVTQALVRSPVAQAIDSVFVHNADAFQIYCATPKLARQRPGFSDIEQSVLANGR